MKSSTYEPGLICNFCNFSKVVTYSWLFSFFRFSEKFVQSVKCESAKTCCSEDGYTNVLRSFRFFKTNRIDGRDFRGCNRQNSWHSRVASDLDQSEYCIVRTNANYLWLKRKLSAFYCRCLPS